MFGKKNKEDNSSKPLCSYCGAVLEPKAVFCIRCGKKALTPQKLGTVLCPQCGEPREVGEMFCKKCGYNYEHASSTIASKKSGAPVQSNAAAGGKKSGPTLIRISTGEQIPINKVIFRLGTDSGRVDYCVKNNSSVSRIHAEIVSYGGNCYVNDKNSGNKTYVNDKPIPPLTDTVISNGDVIKLANEEFMFSA